MSVIGESLGAGGGDGGGVLPQRVAHQLRNSISYLRVASNTLAEDARSIEGELGRLPSQVAQQLGADAAQVVTQLLDDSPIGSTVLRMHELASDCKLGVERIEATLRDHEGDTGAGLTSTKVRSRPRRSSILTRRVSSLLVIDDDPLVCRSLTRLLSPPHAVTTETDARSALERLKNGEEFDLIICDLTMPDMDGPQFYERVAAEHPAYASKTLFMSGGAYEERATRFVNDKNPIVLDKLVSRDVLLAMVERYAGDEHSTQPESVSRDAGTEPPPALEPSDPSDHDPNTAPGGERSVDFTGVAKVLSHDIRSPIRGVLAMSEHLSDEVPALRTGEASTLFGHILQSGERIKGLIDKLETYMLTGLKFKPEQVSLAEVVELALTELGKAGRRVPTVVQGDEATLPVDRDAMVALVCELFDNAATYCEAEPQVEIAVSRVGGAYRIEFRDSGIGIAPRFAQRVFQLGQRLHTYEDYPGSGIGLAIARRVAALHGGTLSLSEGGSSGSTFVLTLPDR